ncbi:hypothetical protein D9611_014250 [Ephemerocybe angulata]|uniref:DUF4219 domain-containing protein n=1 Tax=Ephemerocybe angulata TaxID=980116 RepID=A0A8H5B7S6_9AGAR|nr:hypothetical protein D9611_014250 [Tulosesus angulatus]
MSNTLTTLVSVFDSTNYSTWSDLMWAYLEFQGLSLHVDGTLPRPTAAASSPTSEELEAQAKWDMQDKQARGAIILRLTPSVRSVVIPKKTSKEVWDLLKETYGTPGITVIYADFKKLVSFRFSGNDPRPELAKFQEFLDKLTANKVSFDPFIQTMMLINALPAKYDHLNALILQKHPHCEQNDGDQTEEQRSFFQSATQPAETTEHARE